MGRSPQWHGQWSTFIGLVIRLGEGLPRSKSEKIVARRLYAGRFEATDKTAGAFGSTIIIAWWWCGWWLMTKMIRMTKIFHLIANLAKEAKRAECLNHGWWAKVQRGNWGIGFVRAEGVREEPMIGWWGTRVDAMRCSTNPRILDPGESRKRHRKKKKENKKKLTSTAWEGGGGGLGNVCLSCDLLKWW